MFLSEGYVTENEQIGADPIYAMQIMQEATDDWNDICMKMIKLEHTAIMREDAELLAEGAKEALGRFKNNLVVLGRKLIEYLERVRVQWSKLQASIASKFINANVVSAMVENFKTNKNPKVRVTADYYRALAVVDGMSKATGEIASSILMYVNKNGDVAVGGVSFAGNGSSTDRAATKLGQYNGKTLTDSDDDLEEKIAKILANHNFTEWSGEKEVALTQDMIKKALEFLKKRPAAIKNIETMKKAVTQVQQACIKEMDKTDRPQSKNSLVILQRSFNKLIIGINKATSTAVTICNAVKPNKKYNGISDRDYNKAVENERKSKGVYYKDGDSVKKESVLDLF